MGIRIKKMKTAVPHGAPEVLGDDLITRETTVDGMTYAWGPNQVRNIADDGVAIATDAFDADKIAENGTQNTGNTGNLNVTRT